MGCRRVGARTVVTFPVADPLAERACHPAPFVLELVSERLGRRIDGGALAVLRDVPDAGDWYTDLRSFAWWAQEGNRPRPSTSSRLGRWLLRSATAWSPGGSSPRSASAQASAAARGRAEGSSRHLNGSNDKTVDWVTPFEKKTGCQVNVKLENTSDQMVLQMRTGQYDGVSASGDATLRLIYAGDVAPVNTDLVPSYATISDFLKNKSWNSVDGQMYGIPHGWGANLLMYNLGVVRDCT